jgi:hypothetical protein
VYFTFARRLINFVIVVENNQAEMSAAIIDTQSVKTTEADGPKGYDAGKKVNRRKRSLLVVVQGLLLSVWVGPANLQDRDVGRGPIPRIYKISGRVKAFLVPWSIKPLIGFESTWKFFHKEGKIGF